MEIFMTHKEFKDMILFYLYDELDENKKSVFEQHIDSCNECKLEMESYKKLFSDVDVDNSTNLNPKLLMEARLELRGVLRAQRNKVFESNKISNSIYSFISKPIGMAFSGIFILIIGLFIGYKIFNNSNLDNTVDNPVLNNNLKISNINFIDSDPSDNQIEFTFDAVKPGRFKGNVNDPRLQKILTQAVLNEQNPGTRLNSLNLINAVNKQSFDDEIKKTLIIVSKYDDNPGVRLEALKSLSIIPFDNEIKSTLIYVLLNDTSAGIRIEAINNLVEAAKNGYNLNTTDLSLLREKVQSDQNYYVKFQAKNIIKEY